MRKLTTKQRASVIRVLVEGCSIRSTCRMTGITKQAVMKLVVDLGEACREHHDETVRGLHCERIQADEIWAYVGCKEKSKT
jgi:DNA-directed RNA polymerase specialized sigma24 family protein